MSTVFKLINEKDIPENLPPGQYDTRIEQTYFDEDSNLVIELEFLNRTYDENDPQCLLPLTKEATDHSNEELKPYHQEPFYADEY